MLNSILDSGGVLAQAIILAALVALIIIGAALMLALILLKEPLKDAVRRLTKAGSAEFAPPQPQQQDAPQIKPLGTESKASTSPSDPTLAYWEKEIRGTYEARSKESPASAVDELITGLAIASRAWQFNAIARMIYGTQLFAIRQASLKSDGISDSDLRIIFDEHALRVSSNPNTASSKTDFLAWVNFLTNWKLLELHDQRWRTTEAGKQFLVAAPSLNISEQSPF